MTEAIKSALVSFCDDIEMTGGVGINAKGNHFPLGDEDWIDLGETYIKACKALGREPLIVQS